MDQLHMTPSWRKPFGILLMFVLIGLWAIAAITLIESVSWLDNPIGYGVAGLAWIWILPMRRLMIWMETGRWSAQG